MAIPGVRVRYSRRVAASVPEESTALSRPASTVPARPLRLDNPVQRYDWGSTSAIPELLGVAPDGGPHAELWLGSHASAPSHVDLDGERVALNHLIQQDPNNVLGERIADEYGPRLPYLLKVLAAARALSLQVHPKPHHAREGFIRENAAGVPQTHPSRSFHDDRHKPELLVALSTFEVLAGFRAARSILALLDGVEGELIAQVRAQLIEDRSDASLRQAFHLLLAARNDPAWRADIDRTVASIRQRLADGSPDEQADRAVLELAKQFPGDPGAVAAIMLNRATLQPGDALFVPAAEVHAYLSGVGIELQASSDNVLRAGLTSKYVDEEALIRYASFTPRPPVMPQPSTTGETENVATYRVPVPEFALTIIELEAGESAELPNEGPRIVLCFQGAVELSCDSGITELGQGESVLVPHSAGQVSAAGSGRLVCAWVP